jgi:hypothetical protein
MRNRWRNDEKTEQGDRSDENRMIAMKNRMRCDEKPSEEV